MLFARFYALIAALLAPALASPRPKSATSEATEGSILTARQGCSGATTIGIDFNVNPSIPFATCTDANRNLWSKSTTPQGFTFCHTDFNSCKGASAAGVCFRGGATGYCAPAQAYCESLNGVFAGC